MHRDAVSMFTTLVFLLASQCQSQEVPEQFEFFPGTKIFPSLTADALTHQISLSHVTENRDWVGTIGGSIPIVQANLPMSLLRLVQQCLHSTD